MNVVRAVIHDSGTPSRNDGKTVIENGANFNILGLTGFGISQQQSILFGQEGSSNYSVSTDESYGGITYTTDHSTGTTQASHTLFEFSFLIGIEITQKQ